tara:strand:- start:32746 stop:33735 length:990 start_codon:yes stop_codon:yes gene_type:complete
VTNRLSLVFLGCGFIADLHSRQLRRSLADFSLNYASRNIQKAQQYCRKHGGHRSYGNYDAALEDSSIDAVVIATPPDLHLGLTLKALDAGKHVLVEKPGYLTLADYEAVKESQNRTKKIVLVGENDHYKPLATCLRRLIDDGVIGDMIFANFSTIAKRLKTATDWRNDQTIAGGDAFFEEGIHWLHLANSLGPTITSATGFRPIIEQHEPDRRPKSMLAALKYDNGAVGTIHYSREIPSLLRGLKLSTLYGREGIITFESNGAFVLARGHGLPRVFLPGLRDIRGYQAMYHDFLLAIREQISPAMSLDIAMRDHRLMEQLYDSIGQSDE